MALLVVGVQTGIDALLNDLCAEESRCRFGHTTLENQLDAVWSAHIQVVANDGLKPLAALG